MGPFFPVFFRTTLFLLPQRYEKTSKDCGPFTRNDITIQQTAMSKSLINDCSLGTTRTRKWLPLLPATLLYANLKGLHPRHMLIDLLPSTDKEKHWPLPSVYSVDDIPFLRLPRRHALVASRKEIFGVIITICDLSKRLYFTYALRAIQVHLFLT